MAYSDMQDTQGARKGRLPGRHELSRGHRIRRSTGEKIFDRLNMLMMAVLGLMMLFPFWYVLVLSLNDGADAAYGGIWLFPRKFTFDNFLYVLKNPQLQSAYVITISRTVLGASLTTLVCALAAYSMSKHSLWGRKGLLTIFMIPMFIGGTLSSNFIVLSKLGLVNNFLVYILPSSFNFFYMVVFRTFIYGLPSGLEESAKVDGAGYGTIFFRIILPLSMPVVATLLLFSGVAQWLDFSTNLMYVYDKKLMTVQYLLYQVVRANKMTVLSDNAINLHTGLGIANRQNITSQSIQMAVLMVATLPIIFVYPFMQKYFVKGMMIGAIKG